MAYTTVAKVQSMFRSLKLDAANSALTSAEIQIWIDETSEVLESLLSRFYDMNNVGAGSILVLTRIETLKVAALVDDVLNNYKEAKNKPQYDKKAEAILDKYIPQFNERKCEWCDPMALLPGTPYLGLPSTTTNISVQNVTSGATFKKGVDSW